MWLIDTATYELRYFQSAKLIPYAILSHTWENEEVNFQEMQHPTEKTNEKKGYKKIMACCRQAREDSLKYAWVDTCCIDKSSSAELSEAINSMFNWYRSAAVCYAYLSDVEWFEREANDDSWHATDALSQAKWFTRGWTLQELLASRELIFYSSAWTSLGSKYHFCGALSRFTGISCAAIIGKPLHEFNIAERMSWAANRETTRIEDIAYSLLGIFDVHMPLLYGEGEQAFQRLQEHIIEKTEDYTIYAWSSSNKHDRAGQVLAPLARTPRQFSPIAEWKHSQLATIPQYYKFLPLVDGRAVNLQDTELYEPPTVTSRGIRLRLPLLSQTGQSALGLLTTMSAQNSHKSTWLCIPLQRVYGSSTTYTRSDGELLVRPVDDVIKAKVTQIYLSQHQTRNDWAECVLWHETFFSHVWDLFCQVPSAMSGSALELANRLRTRGWWITIRAHSDAVGYSFPGLKHAYCAKCDYEVLAEAHSGLESINRHKGLIEYQAEMYSALNVALFDHNLTEETHEKTSKHDNVGDEMIYQIITLISRRYEHYSDQCRSLLVCIFKLSAEFCTEFDFHPITQRWVSFALSKTMELSCTIGEFALRIQQAHQYVGELILRYGRKQSDFLLARILRCCEALLKEDELDAFAIAVAQARFRLIALKHQSQDGKSSAVDDLPSSATAREIEALNDSEGLIDSLQRRLISHPPLQPPEEFVLWAKSIFVGTNDLRLETRRLLFEYLCEICEAIEGQNQQRKYPDLVNTVTVGNIARVLQYYAEVEDQIKLGSAAVAEATQTLHSELSSRSKDWHAIVEAIIKDASTQPSNY